MRSYRRRRFKKRYHKQKFFSYLFIFATGVIILGLIFAFSLFAWYAKDLPSPGKLSSNSNNSSVFYDRNEEILFESYKDKNRIPVSLNNISEFMQQATISIEDKNFYQHKGISEKGILRAFLNILFKKKLQGGSTITQQLIKNVLLTPQRTVPRKIKEMILAIEVERRYTKNQILEMYLNEAPYGGSLWGIESAAKGYFNKPAKNLNLIESAILSGLPQRPSYYSPYIGDPNAWKPRAKNVLRRMREDQYISQAQEKKAIKEMDKITFKTQGISIKAPHFVFYVKKQIEDIFGPKIFEKGIKVKTTLSLDLQEKAQKIVTDEIKKLKKFKVSNGSLIILDTKTDQILSMVGSYDFNNQTYGKFNASLGFRQPGSAIKPITYALAFKKGYTPATVIMDTKTVFPDQGNKEYIPVNYDGKFRGPVQIRFALGNSINVPAVKILAMSGIKDFLSLCSQMGLKTLEPNEKNLKRFGLAITLGGGETTLLDLSSAYSVFARGGIQKNPQSIIEITDFKGNTIYKPKEEKGRKVLIPEISFLISHILSDNNARKDEFGANSYLKIPGKTVSVKTGTTNDKRDNWTVGFTKDITIGVWVGNNDNSPMNKKIASGLTGASPIWHKMMVSALKKYSDGIIDKPDDVKALEIDAYLGGLPKEGYPTRSEYFIEGTEPKDISPFYKKLKISKSNGKLANQIEIKSGNYEEKDFIVITEKDPISTNGKNRWQEGIDQWASQQNNDKLHYPTEISDSQSDQLIIQIKNPKDKEKINSNKITLNAKINSIEPIKEIEIYLNNKLTLKYKENKNEINEDFDLTDGVYELKIKATNTKDKTAESTVKFGINKPWDYQKPTSEPTPTLTITPTETIAPTSP